MRKIIAIIVVALILMNSSFCHAASWYWAKPVYNNGLATLQMVKIEYSCDTNDVSELAKINQAISQEAMEGNFQNFQELKELINSWLHNSTMRARNFDITHVGIVDL